MKNKATDDFGNTKNVSFVKAKKILYENFNLVPFINFQGKQHSSDKGNDHINKNKRWEIHNSGCIILFHSTVRATDRVRKIELKKN
jgi:hypothetical protein